MIEKVQDYVKKSHITTQNEQKSEKTAQDVQKNCLSLTEQWKKGELEIGCYYIKEADGFYGIMSDYELYRVNLGHPDNTISLLAPVPSYEEWQDIKEDLKTCDNDLNNVCEQKEKLFEENQKLKELLKECREVAEFTKTIVNKHKWFNEVITKIDEVLK